MEEKYISINLKTLRKRKEITLQELSDMTGLTKGYLSKVERSEKAPPYSTLKKITEALEVEITAIFTENIEAPESTRISFSRAGESRRIKETSRLSGYDYEVLAARKPGKSMEPFIIYAPPKIRKMYSHEGEEFIYVLDGELEFVFGKRKFTMEKGDNVYFDACVPHSGRSLGKTKARLLVVIYSYRKTLS